MKSSSRASPMVVAHTANIERLRKVLVFLPGEELFVALCSKAIHQRVLIALGKQGLDGELPPVRTSALLYSKTLTQYGLQTGMLEPSKTILNLAAEHGCLAGMQVLRELDPPVEWDDGGINYDMDTCGHAAKNGHVHILRWARAQDDPAPWDERTCKEAAKNGHLEVLKWVRAQDPPCPWNEWTCTQAGWYGHLDILKWARAQTPPCPWSEGTMQYAASGGHLHVVKWLRSQNAPWDSRTCESAKQNGHLHVFKWARDNGCPLVG